MVNESGYRDTFDALQRLVPRSEHGACALYLIKVGLWPDTLSPESARARMSACLNPAKPEALKPQELLALMEWKRRYDVIYYWCDRLGLSRPMLLDSMELLSRAAQIAHENAEQAKTQLEHTQRLMDLARSRIGTNAGDYRSRFSLPNLDEFPDFEADTGPDFPEDTAESDNVVPFAGNW